MVESLHQKEPMERKNIEKAIYGNHKVTKITKRKIIYNKTCLGRFQDCGRGNSYY
jgi:hypothetical protein